MFTGLIEAVGRVRSLAGTAAGARLTIDTALSASLTAGDSVAVNGVCLTATAADAQALVADLGPETMRVTTLGGLSPGRPVNLERPMRADGRVGGHFVQGHVDGTGTVAAIRPEGDARWVTVRFPSSLERLFIRKGSVAVDGVSLTVAELRGGEFDVMIVPFTWAHTNLPSLKIGELVNLECDMIGKYVVRAMELTEDRPGTR
jgi:riboflavin synthase